MLQNLMDMISLIYLTFLVNRLSKANKIRGKSASKCLVEFSLTVTSSHYQKDCVFYSKIIQK
jgi:hypothetical protein